MPCGYFWRTFLSFIGNTTESLFKEGEKIVDYQPLVEKSCPTNLEHITLDPNKKCKDRFYVTENSTLVLRDPQEPYQAVYRAEDFCIEINGHAKNKDEHLARICIDNREKKLRMK